MIHLKSKLIELKNSQKTYSSIEIRSIFSMIQMGILTKALRSQLVEKLYLARAASLGYLCHAASLRLVFGVNLFSFFHLFFFILADILLILILGQWIQPKAAFNGGCV